MHLFALSEVLESETELAARAEAQRAAAAARDQLWAADLRRQAQS